MNKAGKMELRARIFISGIVQGVFFRDHTRRWASSLGLKGWVKNMPDNRVEVLVEGKKEDIDDLVRRLSQGSPMSHVDDVHVDWEKFRGEFQTFRITY
jgi:acylphosphatase